MLHALPPPPEHDARQTFIWRHETNAYPPLDLPGLGTLRLRATFGEGLRAETRPGQRSPSGSGRVANGSDRSGVTTVRELKKLLQEAGIPPWKRDRLPLIYLPHAHLAPRRRKIQACWRSSGWVLPPSRRRTRRARLPARFAVAIGDRLWYLVASLTTPIPA